MSRCLLLTASLVWMACDAPQPAFKEISSGEWVDEKLGDQADANEQPANPSLITKSWKFDSKNKRSGSLRIENQDEFLETEITMEDLLADRSLVINQVQRKLFTETFEGGSESRVYNEIFKQDESSQGQLDILVVIDNSGSMVEEQQNLSTKLSPLLSYVSKSDWQIAVVTTDPEDGCLRSLITRDDRDPLGAFSRAIQAGVQGSGNERGILQAVRSLRMDCEGEKKWLREASSLAVMIVSDEDNCSDTSMCNNKPWQQSDYLLDYLSSIRKLGEDARVYGIFWDPSQSSNACSSAHEKAWVYKQAVEASGGSWGSICSQDYSETLSATSQDIETILKNQFVLSKEPILDSLEVRVGGKLLTEGYRLVSNVIEFEQAPEAGSVIDVNYQSYMKPATREITLKRQPYSSSLRLTLDGSLVDSSDYKLEANRVVFKQPIRAQLIKAEYKESKELSSRFVIGSTPVTGSLEVYVNNYRLDESAYRLQGQELVFLNAPEEAAKIEFKFQEAVAPKLVYYSPVDTDLWRFQESYDKSSLESIELKVGLRGEIEFPSYEHRKDRRVIVRYAKLDESDDQIAIDLDRVFVESIQLEGEFSGICYEWFFSGSYLDYSECDFDPNEAVKMSFEMSASALKEFSLGELSGLDTMSVRVDGLAVRQWRYESPWLILDEGLEYGSILEVEASLVSNK